MRSSNEVSVSAVVNKNFLLWKECSLLPIIGERGGGALGKNSDTRGKTKRGENEIIADRRGKMP